MLLAHVRTLAQARSNVAALADQARSHEASSAYEHVLIALDSMHGDQSPALDASGPTSDEDLLFAVASSAIEDLKDHDVDLLEVELLLAILEDAQALGET